MSIERWNSQLKNYLNKRRQLWCKRTILFLKQNQSLGSTSLNIIQKCEEKKKWKKNRTVTEACFYLPLSVNPLSESIEFTCKNSPFLSKCDTTCFTSTKILTVFQFFKYKLWNEASPLEGSAVYSRVNLWLEKPETNLVSSQIKGKKITPEGLHQHWTKPLFCLKIRNTFHLNLLTRLTFQQALNMKHAKFTNHYLSGNVTKWFDNR